MANLIALVLALQSPWKHADDLDAALADAKAANKVVVATFRSDSSADCRRMDEVYAGPEVAKILAERVVAVRINFDAKADLAKAWRASRVPWAVFITPGGVRLTDLRGWHPTKVVVRTLTRLADTWPPIAEALRKRDELALAGQPTQGENAKLLARYIEIDAPGPAAIQMATLSDLGKVTDPVVLADMYLVESWGAKSSPEAIVLLDKALAADPDNKSGHVALFVRARAGRFMTARDGKGLLVAVEEAMKRFPQHEEIDWFWTAKVRAYELLEDWKKGIETADAALGVIGDSPWRRAIENMKRECQKKAEAEPKK
jgi:hypothetical protein